jgi:hypothetical protein
VIVALLPDVLRTELGESLIIHCQIPQPIGLNSFVPTVCVSFLQHLSLVGWAANLKKRLTCLYG